MKLIEVQTRIEKLAYIPFKEYQSPDQVQDVMMKINKGKTGQLLELTIGLNLSNTTLDFEDGELKTNKCDRTIRNNVYHTNRLYYRRVIIQTQISRH